MSIKKIDFVCPKCHKKLRVKLYQTVDNTKIPDILNRDLFKIKCKACNEEVWLNYSIVLNADNYSIYYKVNDDKIDIPDKKSIMRLCTNYEDFKEKILILEDNLNDILIEFIKKIIVNDLSEDDLDSFNDIRYDGKNEEALIFYLIGLDKFIGFRISVYDDILKRSKFRGVDDLVEITKDTYLNYYKVMPK